MVGSLLLPVYSTLTGSLRASLVVPGLSLLFMASLSVHMSEPTSSLADYPSTVAGLWAGQFGQEVSTQAVAVVVFLGLCITASAFVGWTGRIAVHRVLAAERAPGILRAIRGKHFDRFNNRHQIDPPANYRPECLTPVGEATRLLTLRVHSQYHLNITAAWPRVALIADDRLTAAVATVQAHYRTHLSVVAWGLLALPLGWLWLPASAIALTAVLIGYSQSCRCAHETVLLIESGLDVNQAALAASVGIALPNGRIDKTEGQRINNILTKRAHREKV